MSVLKFHQDYEDLQRFRRIIKVLVKHGFGFLVGKIHLKHKFPFFKRLKHYKSVKVTETLLPVRVRMILEELGPTFIKLGQVLSTRPDLVGEEFAKEFERLQDKAPPLTYDFVENLIKKELGSSVKNLFASFDEKPIASASLGQVHKAVLKDGSKVVVKVQRPNIQKTIKGDINIMRRLALLTEKHVPEAKIYNLNGIIDEFERAINKELNYFLEGRNVDKFHKNFENDETIYVPKVYWNYSTKHILTLEYIPGVKINRIDKYKEKFDKKLVAERIANSFFKQVFAHGFFHADPHPANIFVLHDNVICFLDYGMVGHLDKEFLNEFTNFIIAIINQDVDGIINELRYMGLLDETIEISSFKAAVIDMLDAYYDTSLKQLELGGLISELLITLTKYRIKIPKDIVLLSKALLILEGIGKKIDPEFNTVNACKPFIKAAIKRKISPKRLTDLFKNNILEFEHLIKTSPQKITKILSRLEEGKFKVCFEDEDLKKIFHYKENSSKRIAFSIVISAVIIASALIIQTDKGPLLLGFPVLGIIGFTVASFLGLCLFIIVLRS